MWSIYINLVEKYIISRSYLYIVPCTLNACQKLSFCYFNLYVNGISYTNTQAEWHWYNIIIMLMIIIINFKSETIKYPVSGAQIRSTPPPNRVPQIFTDSNVTCATDTRRTVKRFWTDINQQLFNWSDVAGSKNVVGVRYRNLWPSLVYGIPLGPSWLYVRIRGDNAIVRQCDNDNTTVRWRQCDSAMATMR
jgi:hypothetical protein